MLASFCDWMRQQRGVSDTTLSIYRFELRAFLTELGEDSRLYDARNLRQFVLDIRGLSAHIGPENPTVQVLACYAAMASAAGSGAMPPRITAAVC